MSRRLFSYLFVMFISPLLGLVLAMRKRSRTLKRWALITFITFFGSTLMIQQGNDGWDHQNRVYEHYVDLDAGQFFTELGEILMLVSNRATNDDVYIHTLSWFVGTILGAPRLFFVFVAFIYAYFFVGSIFKVFQIFPTRKLGGWLFFLFGIIFLFWIGLDGISPVRNGTGLWVLFYSCLSYYQTRKLKYMILMFTPPLFHIGYLAMAIPAWGVFFVGNRKMAFSVIFFISFISTILNPAVITQQLARTELGASKVEGYYVEERASVGERLENLGHANWYKRYFKLGLHYYGAAFIAAVLILSGVYFKVMNEVESSVFSIGILTKALANSSWFLFAVATRSNVIAGVFILAALLMIWQRGHFDQPLKSIRRQRFWLAVSLVFFVVFFVYTPLNLIYWVSIFIVVLPFIPWVDQEWNLSIRQAITQIFGV